MKEKIEEIINKSINAPSGSNSQPWSFKVKDNVVEIIAHPEKDHPILNFQNRGTYIAHGALIENIEIASRYFGYEPEIEIFPYKENLNITAKITFKEGSPQIPELFDVIEKRCSNRKPYEKFEVDKETINYFLKEVQERNNGVEIHVVNDREKIKNIASVLAQDIKLFFINKVLHESLYKEILWKRGEDKYKPGLYIKTLEMPPIGIVIFKLLKKWSIAQFLRKKGLIDKMVLGNSMKNSMSSLFIGIFCEDNPESFINAGRILENIWLRITKKDFSAQFITGIMFLYQQLNFGKKEIFSTEEAEIINNSYNQLIKNFDYNSNKKMLIGVLRVGKSDPPAAVSFKRPPVIKYD